MKTLRTVKLLVALALITAFGYGAFVWFVNRVYVDEGYSLMGKALDTERTLSRRIEHKGLQGTLAVSEQMLSRGY